MTNEIEIIKRSAASYIKELYDFLAKVDVTDALGMSHNLNQGVAEAIDLITKGKAASKKVMVIGNGGSAAIAGHMQNDLCKAVGVRAMVFNDAPLMTALSNDNGYDCVYKQPLALWAGAGDILIAISSSGRSKNILDAVESGRSLGCSVLTFSGFDIDNSLRKLGDLNFYIPSGEYGYVETAHAVLTHLITDLAADTQVGEGEGG